MLCFKICVLNSLGLYCVTHHSSDCLCLFSGVVSALHVMFYQKSCHSKVNLILLSWSLCNNKLCLSSTGTLYICTSVHGSQGQQLLFSLQQTCSPFLDRPICPSLGALCPSLWGLGPPPWPLTWGCPGLYCPAGPGCRGGPPGGMSSGIPEAPYMSRRCLLLIGR